MLFFYPLDFTFVCPTEITSFSDRFADFAALNTEVLGCSVDSEFSHLAWVQTGMIVSALFDSFNIVQYARTATVGVVMEAVDIFS